MIMPAKKIAKKTVRKPAPPQPPISEDMRSLPGRSRPKPMYADWLASEENVKWIKYLLLDPRFTELNDIIIASAEGTEAALLTDPAPDNVVVRKAAFAAGLRSFTRKMFELCLPKRVPTPEAVPYAHYKPELEL